MCMNVSRGGMSHWGLYIIRVKRVYFHHPARNARIVFRVSKTGKYGKKLGYQIHRSAGRTGPPTIHGKGRKFGSDTPGAGLVRTRGSSSFRVPFRE